MSHSKRHYRHQHFLALSISAFATGAGLAQSANPTQMVDALESTFGVHSTARRSHAKGICASGYFVGNAKVSSISNASVFSGNRIPVTARFSVGGGNPQASDKGKTVRGLALKFNLPDNEQWLMANLSAPVFFVAKPEHFASFILARKPDPATGRPDPALVKAFNDAHPDTQAQIAWLAQAPVPASYASIDYFGIHAFRFTNAAGQTQMAKWSFTPVGGQQGLSDEELAKLPDHFLATELRSRIARKALEFDFKLQLANPGDDTINPTVQWPRDRRTVDAGRLVIEQLDDNLTNSCDGITFNPLILPKGISASDDPVLLARAAPYAISLNRRTTTRN
jgi:catalase